MIIVGRLGSWSFACFIVLLICAPRLHAQNEGTKELTVFAAASLTEAFQSLGKKFEAANPGVKVVFNFGGSQQLVQQAGHGANADVLALANAKQMMAAARLGLVDSNAVSIFARNRLVIILPAGNAAALRSIADLAKHGIKLVLADSSVPAGLYARQFFDRCDADAEYGAGFRRNVLANVVSYEENVRSVLAKVELGECDAGIVYVSDVVNDTRHRVERIEIPERLNILAEYPIAVVDRHSAQVAGQFLRLVLSEQGREVLRRYGFSAETGGR